MLVALFAACFGVSLRITADAGRLNQRQAAANSTPMGTKPVGAVFYGS